MRPDISKSVTYLDANQQMKITFNMKTHKFASTITSRMTKNNDDYNDNNIDYDYAAGNAYLIGVYTT